jgi:hypothetical protein
MRMKKSIGKFILSSKFQNSLLVSPFRSLVRASSGMYRYSPQFLADFQAIERPHYAYCMLRAVELAQQLKLDAISAIEFGVAGGNGLAFMEDFAKEVRRATGVTIQCYGFDTGKGMPDPEGVKDLPFWFQAAQYPMDEAKLRARVPDSTLVIGDIRSTVDSFIETHRPAPIGVIFNDTDYWSSTLASFRLFDAVAAYPEHFLPRIYKYFDDIIGTHTEMYGPYNGQLAAIEEFNRSRENMKIHLNQNLLSRTEYPWRFQIYYCHLFDHPRYNDYVGGAQQDDLQGLLRLQPK